MKNIHKILTISLLLANVSCMESIKESTKKAIDKTKNVLSFSKDSIPKGYIKDLKQGFELDKKIIDKIKIGMSKSEVKKILGTPSIIDPFHKNRWDYINKSRINEKIISKSFTLIFKQDNTLQEIKNIQ